MKALILSLVALTPAIASAAGVVAITPTSFGPNTVIETFEDVVTFGIPQEYIPFDGGLLTYGIVPLGYVLPSGIAVTGIAQGAGDAAWLFDWSLPYFYQQLWYLGTGGTVHQQTPLQSGSAFLAHKNDATGLAIEFTFPAPAYRAGVFVEAYDNGIATLRAFDAQGNLLGSHYVQTDGVSANGIDTFLGVQSQVPMARIEVHGFRVALDDLMFDPDAAAIYGNGCAGTGGFVPSLHVAGSLKPGTEVSIDINGGLGGAVAFLMIGTTAVELPVGGGPCALQVSPVMVVLPVSLSGSGPGAGNLSLPSRVPGSTPLGTVATLQAWIVDSAQPVGAAATNAVQITVLP